jgi:hypothetical protein
MVCLCGRYGADFVTALSTVRSSNKNGAFITSCICHGCPWLELKLDNRSAYELYGAWYADAAHTSEHVHIDPSLTPNSGGELQKEFPTYCVPFP